MMIYNSNYQSFNPPLRVVVCALGACFASIGTCAEGRFEFDLDFRQQIRTVFTEESGLPSRDVQELAFSKNGVIHAKTSDGIAVFTGSEWKALDRLQSQTTDAEIFAQESPAIENVPKGNLFGLVNEESRNSVGHEVMAAENGLYYSENHKSWQQVFPEEGSRRWAPVDVRCVEFDSQDRIWFACPQGVGVGIPGGEWQLFTGKEGLPYNDFTSMAIAPDDSVWFGTKIGAIHFDKGTWEYRQGRRWLPHDQIQDIEVDSDGDVWIATSQGVSRIHHQAIHLSQKAEQFEQQIDRYHKRTPYEYVLSVRLKSPGDKTEWTQQDSDNDGLWTAMYGTGECFAYGATGQSKFKVRAEKAFRALAFLSEVTQGGSHPAPKGFIARTILPTRGRNPNIGRIEGDRRNKADRDSLWKIIDPRWPVSADGKWYWKTDASSDELDGHYFFYLQYYDLVAETESEKQAVRDVVIRITDHLIDHGFNLIDHDGRITRWANYGPEFLNHDKNWLDERGLNSLSILSYLRVAEHVSGDSKYAEAAEQLMQEHSYHVNVFNAKQHRGPGWGNQSDDEMAFMCFYNLIRLEKDPELKSLWHLAFHRYWIMESPELNPLFNFMYAAVSNGAEWTDAFGKRSLTVSGDWLSESLDTLRRYPLDRIRWGMRNSHRLDLLPISVFSQPGRGLRRNGKVLPIDERFVEQWNHDPWRLDEAADGRQLSDPASFLLPYYMGLYHRFIR
ncbi:MAG TPA: hypothetical protein EYG38_04335 [Verrucomicrobia bacterium]|nr:hypothetical protein [Verrucomicrobiota bacterium]